jgi:hypothetical protein
VPVGTALALNRGNASPGRYSDGRQPTFPHEREAHFASRIAMYGIVRDAEKVDTYPWPSSNRAPHVPQRDGSKCPGSVPILARHTGQGAKAPSTAAETASSMKTATAMACAVGLDPDRKKSHAVGTRDTNAPRMQVRRTPRRRRYFRIWAGVGYGLPTRAPQLAFDGRHVMSGPAWPRTRQESPH